MKREKTFLEGRALVKTGDITQERVDAVVNAANSSLMGGGGVDGAIHRAGGPSILQECREVRKSRYPDGLPTGQAVMTTAGKLPAQYVIHTVGPVWRGGKGNEAALLADCYRNSLSLAVQAKLKTVAFPAISTGIYGYPKNRAAKAASGAISEFLKENRTLEQIRLVFFSEADADNFLRNCEWP